MTASERTALISRCPEVAKVFDELDHAHAVLRLLLGVSPQPAFLSQHFRRRWEDAVTQAENVLGIVHEPQSEKVAGGPCKVMGGEDDPKQWAAKTILSNGLEHC